jgi:hypothetical protein
MYLCFPLNHTVNIHLFIGITKEMTTFFVAVLIKNKGATQVTKLLHLFKVRRYMLTL